MEDLVENQEAEVKEEPVNPEKNENPEGESLHGPETEQAFHGSDKVKVESAAVKNISELTDPVPADEENDRALEGKSVDELRQLHVDALSDESEIKRELYLLRARSANQSTHDSSDTEKAIEEHKSMLADAVDWIKSIEKKLRGELKDYSGINF